MKKIVSLIIAGCLLCSPVYAKSKKKENIAQTEIKFMDIPWNSTSEEVNEKMIGASFVQTRKNTIDGFDLFMYEGRVSGGKIGVMCMYGDNKLAKIVVDTEPQDDPAAEFIDKEAVLKAKYGEPKKEIRKYDSPYDNGKNDDSDFKTGLKVKRIFIADTFEDKNGVYLILQITDRLALEYIYETDYFRFLIDERDKKENKIF
ncbi:MAG: hypothetical protein EOL93_10165 [Epsilonproteobacteria bacterium]|nr:hypothetical protein [Campylobacterota bacterium]